MINLLLAIVFAASITLFMRLLDSQIQNNMTMFTSNYLVCIICSIIFLLCDGGTLSIENVQSGLSTAIFLGAINGVMYLLSIVLLQFNIQRNGVILASTFMKMGVIVPVLMAMIFFADKPSWFQIAGFAFALSAIIAINEPNQEDEATVSGKKGSFIFLIILLVAGGFTDSIANIFEKMGSESYKNHFLLCTFVVAILASGIGIIIKKQRVTAKDILCGVCIGIPNYFSARFLLQSLSDLPAIVVYPVFNVSIILIITAIGVVAFKEKMSLRKGLGILFIIITILCEIL